MIALKKNKRFLFGLFALIVAVSMISVGITLAAANWSATGRETNVLTLGNINIKLIDIYTENDNVEPGVDVPKTVEVENIGSAPCYVRVWVKKTWSSGSGASPSTDLILPNYDLVHWVKGSEDPSANDGYECYYYKGTGNGVLSKGKKTEPLFTSFKLDEKDKDSYKGLKGQITVKSEAVQTDHIDLGGDVTKWPADLKFTSS